ncbi:hypothetical protein ACE6H2_012183 [Prunus campanulata]
MIDHGRELLRFQGDERTARKSKDSFPWIKPRPPSQTKVTCEKMGKNYYIELGDTGAHDMWPLNFRLTHNLSSDMIS